jgi:hypothetical protein
MQVIMVKCNKIAGCDKTSGVTPANATGATAPKNTAEHSVERRRKTTLPQGYEVEGHVQKET